ncbi:MAG: cysteine desulfurase NifS [Clostridia bacterium]|nr:cysteine desulfurase NifS [Clostridia bacterium]
MDRIYLDYAATSPVLPEVLDAMLPFFMSCFGNPSGIHENGRETRKAVEQARREVAETLGAESREIVFTSGGSESDNLAIEGTAFALREKGNHIITSQIEHHAVLNTCRWLEKQGFRVTYLPVDASGLVDPDSVRDAIGNDTVLVSIMTANNEIGTVEPVSKIGEICREKGVLFHTDAVQAIGMMNIHAAEINADLISLSAHKFHGPKGTGALYIRKGTKLESLIHGGAQERGLRAGTENVPGIVGMGKAITVAAKEREENQQRIRELRDQMIRIVLERIPGSQLNGHPEKRLANNCHFSFAGIESEALLLRLDLAGISVSGGSACTSGSMEPSHVLQAIGLKDEMLKSGIRMTMGRETTREEIEKTAEKMSEIIADLRQMSHSSIKHLRG